MADRVPINGCYPAVFIVRKRYGSVNDQLIELAVVIEVVRIQREDHSLAQLHSQLSKVFHGADTIHPHNSWASPCSTSSRLLGGIGNRRRQQATRVRRA